MYLGIDIGGTYIKYALVNEQFQIARKWKKETRLFEDKDLFYDYLCDGLAGISAGCVLAGVSAPGVITHSRVMSKAARNVEIMCGTDVSTEVEARIHVKTAAFNDARAAGLCEFKMGSGKGASSSVYFLIGTGIGGCICDRGGVIEGKDGVAGEFSAIPFGWDAKGRPGFLAEYASMSALIEIYNDRTDRPLMYGAEICGRYLEGEPAAAEAVGLWITYICYGLHQIIQMYNPEIICIGGGISEEEWFLEKLQARFRECPFPFSDLVTTRIERCRYRNDANLLGAVLHAREVLKNLP